MTTHTVALAKGGSTKTTTAAELAHTLAANGRKVLAIDLDQQGNLTSRLGITAETPVPGDAADVLSGADPADAALASPTVPGVDVLIGTDALVQVVARQAAVVTVLRDRIPTWHTWDDVVIDTPPALGPLVIGALAAADLIVVPVPCPEPEAWEQIARLESYLDAQVRIMRPDVAVNWIIPTKYDKRRRFDRDVLTFLEEEYPGKVSPPVREATVAREAYMAGQPIGVYAPRAGVSQDYAAALKPLLATANPNRKRTAR